MPPRLIHDEVWPHGLYNKFTYEDNTNVMENMNQNWDAFVDMFVPGLFARSNKPGAQDMEWFREQAKKNSPNVMVRTWLSMSSRSYLFILPHIKVPVLVAYGEESGLLRAANSDYMADKIPDARAVSFKKCGHMPHYEDARNFNQVLYSFIEE